MRSYLLIPLLMAPYAAPSCAASASQPRDLLVLEHAWHSCVREAYARQPLIQSKLAAQRSALDECMGYEDSYVFAVQAAQIAEEEAQSREMHSAKSRAASWASYMAAYVVEPVSSWVRALRR